MYIPVGNQAKPTQTLEKMTTIQMISYLKDQGTKDVAKYAGSIADQTGDSREKVLELIEANTETPEDTDVAADRRAYKRGNRGGEPKSINTV